MKTIKDLDFYDNIDYPSECQMCGFSMTKLRQEAIKRIKKYLKECLTGEERDTDMMVHFFNITKEDLK